MKMMKSYILRLFLLLALALSSCIKDDIPYPYIELYITSVEADGTIKTTVDNPNRTVTLTLEEQTDIRNVNITDVTYTDGAKLTDEVVGQFDMRLPLTTTLYQYQSYDWQIVATQEIERYFKVKYQLGSEVIDVDNKEVTLNVNNTYYDPSAVEVTDMKLGAADITTYSPTASELTTFSSQSGGAGSRIVKVTSHGREESWYVTITPITPSVTLEVDICGTVAYLFAEGDTTDPSKCKLFYREADSSEWIEFAPDSASGGAIKGTLTGSLSANTTYEFYAECDGVSSLDVGITQATTDACTPLENGSFEDWSKDGVAWYPYLSDATTKYWGTGNPGSTTLGDSNNTTTYDTSIVALGDRSARLESLNVMKLAAGNIFTGSYGSTHGTNGSIKLGQPFTERPIALKGYAKYNSEKVNIVGDVAKLAKDQWDQGIIYVALGTWKAEDYGVYTDNVGETQYMGDATSPVAVYTKDESTFFRSTTDDVIAYGELVFNYGDEYEDDLREFTITLNYNDLNGVRGTSRTPTHIIIVGSSSRYGDYFNGGVGSTLYLDGLELVYDIK